MAVGVAVDVLVEVGETVGVDVAVPVGLDVEVGVEVLVGVEPDPVTLTSSMYQPYFAVPLSAVIRNRMMTFEPAYELRSTTTCDHIPTVPPVQADRPPMGLPEFLEIVPLYPPVVILLLRSLKVMPPSVEISMTDPSYPFSIWYVCQKLNRALEGSRMERVSR